jgi:hypothetical protein
MLAMLSVVALIGAGCGGISASQSVSPATFLLPGILKNCPQCPQTNEIAFIPENSAPLAFSR